MPRAAFLDLGGFDTSLELAEDLDLVVRARAAGMPLQFLDARVITSARRYRRNGWLKTTASFAWLTVRLSRTSRRRLRATGP